MKKTGREKHRLGRREFVKIAGLGAAENPEIVGRIRAILEEERTPSELFPLVRKKE
ncbi:MAG: hypothetical protein KKC69_06955 [Acidobacteria bacterium]|nr:hypothetical protein [Acidobacteriota bacterium]